MKPHWFFILLSVSAAPRYGTAIQDDVRELSGGGMRLWPATLYGSLEELVEQGWLEEVAEDDRPEGISGRERFYRATRAGRVALGREAARLESLARVARVRLATGGA
jgi:DNA-binding PadR family transcriptional regulator